MGIAHANGGHLQRDPSHLQFAIRQRSPRRKVGGDGGRLQERLAHVNRDLITLQQARNHQPGRCFHAPLGAAG